MTSVGALVVGLRDDVTVGLEGGGITTDRVGSVEEATDRIEESDRFLCVVGVLDGEELAGAADLELVDAVRRIDELLPIVLVGERPLADVAPALIGADVADYVQSGAADWESTLRTAVEDAATSYRRRLDRVRVHADHPDPACVLRDGEVVAASDGFGDPFCLPESQDVLGSSLRDLVAADDRGELADALAAASAETQQCWLTPDADLQRTVELRFRRSAVDDAIVVRAADVTADAARRESVEEAAAQLDSLLRNIPMSIYFKDELGRHERVSHYITQTDPENYIMNDEGKVHPYADDVIGKTDFDLYAPSFAEETYADDMNVMEEEEPVINRIEDGTTSLGEPLYTSTTKVPRYDADGDVVGLVGVSIDVTERVTHREELERQNERLNEFAEVLTHDLRNPLNIAQGYLDVLEDGYDETAVQESAMALDRVESLIEEIREFVLEGRVVETPEAVDLRDVATEAWSTVDTGAAEIEIEGDLRLKSDRSRLRRMLENLFRNAIEHGAPGAADATGVAEDGTGVGLTVRVEAGRNEFAVEDDGAGIPDGVEPEELFERGFSTSDDGTGFGLAIVESIAEAHGWSVDVDVGSSGGARFEFGDVVRAEAEIGQTISD